MEPGVAKLKEIDGVDGLVYSSPTVSNAESEAQEPWLVSYPIWISESEDGEAHTRWNFTVVAEASPTLRKLKARYWVTPDDL